MPKLLKLYLDVCCLNRPFDDQTQDRIRLETEAIIAILKYSRSGAGKIIGSNIIQLEIDKTPDLIRRSLLKSLSEYISVLIYTDKKIKERAIELQIIGFKAFDSFHIACAEKGNADVFLTTDDKIIKLAVQNKNKIKVKVYNPLNWVQENILK
ncbi:MAG: PIN domain-containing protein [Spirochaetota bacterium]